MLFVPGSEKSGAGYGVVFIVLVYPLVPVCAKILYTRTMALPEKSANRFAVLDHLRGYFIAVIIIDHLSRWPSLFSAVTGKAQLWVTAAEGFVAISGLLVGYVRGYKNRDQPLWAVSKKLISRALILYLWAIIGTVGYVAWLWAVNPLPGGAPGIRIQDGDWLGLILNAVTLQYTFVWVYFLALYALFLAVAPVAIWLLRVNKAWLLGLSSSLLLVVGWQLGSMPLQWQFLFFIPAIVGYYLDPLLSKWKGLPQRVRRSLAIRVVIVTVLTIGISVVTTFYPATAGTLVELNNSFPKDVITIPRALMAFLWFIGFVFIFFWAHRSISKWLGWLLIPIGTRSLTSYILHGVALIAISAVATTTDSIIINTLLGAIAVLLVWAMLKIPHINKVIPQ